MSQPKYVTEAELRGKYILISKAWIGPWITVGGILLTFLGYANWEISKAALAKALEDKGINAAVDKIKADEVASNTAAMGARASALRAKQADDDANDLPKQVSQLRSDLGDENKRRDHDIQVVVRSLDQIYVQADGEYHRHNTNPTDQGVGAGYMIATLAMQSQDLKTALEAIPH